MSRCSNSITVISLEFSGPLPIEEINRISLFLLLKKTKGTFIDYQIDLVCQDQYSKGQKVFTRINIIFEGKSFL